MYSVLKNNLDAEVCSCKYTIHLFPLSGSLDADTWIFIPTRLREKYTPHPLLVVPPSHLCQHIPDFSLLLPSLMPAHSQNSHSPRDLELSFVSFYPMNPMSFSSLPLPLPLFLTLSGCQQLYCQPSFPLDAMVFSIFYPGRFWSLLSLTCRIQDCYSK